MKVLQCNSKRLSSLSSHHIWGKGKEGNGREMIRIAEKLQLWFSLQKTLIFPWPFCLDVLTSLLDQGYTSQIHFPTLILAKLNSYHRELCALFKDLSTLTTFAWFTGCVSRLNNAVKGTNGPCDPVNVLYAFHLWSDQILCLWLYNIYIMKPARTLWCTLPQKDLKVRINTSQKNIPLAQNVVVGP